MPWDQMTESYTLRTEPSSAAVEYLVRPVVVITASRRVSLAPYLAAAPLAGPPMPSPSPAREMYAPSTVTSVAAPSA